MAVPSTRLFPAGVYAAPSVPLDEALDHAPIGVALLGPDGRWWKVNPAVSRLLGYSAEELSRMTFADVTHPEDVGACVDRRRSHLARSEDVVNLEKRYVRSDGEVVW